MVPQEGVRLYGRPRVPEPSGRNERPAKLGREFAISSALKEDPMKHAWMVAACTFIFVSAVGFAQPPSQAPLTSEALAAILSQPADGGSCISQQSSELYVAKRPRLGSTKAFCEATCGTYPNISCSGQGCSAANRNCTTGEVGYVTCDGVTTSCPGTPREFACCQCSATNDCWACCYCHGGGPIICSEGCNGG